MPQPAPEAAISVWFTPPTAARPDGGCDLCRGPPLEVVDDTQARALLTDCTAFKVACCICTLTVHHLTGFNRSVHDSLCFSHAPFARQSTSTTTVHAHQSQSNNQAYLAKKLIPGMCASNQLRGMCSRADKLPF